MKNHEFVDGEESTRTVTVKINGVEHGYICTQQEAYTIAHTLKGLFDISCRVTVGINGLFADEEKDENNNELIDYTVTVSENHKV